MQLASYYVKNVATYVVYINDFIVKYNVSLFIRQNTGSCIASNLLHNWVIFIRTIVRCLVITLTQYNVHVDILYLRIHS